MGWIRCWTWQPSLDRFQHYGNTWHELFKMQMVVRCQVNDGLFCTTHLADVLTSHQIYNWHHWTAPLDLLSRNLGLDKPSLMRLLLVIWYRLWICRYVNTLYYHHSQPVNVRFNLWLFLFLLSWSNLEVSRNTLTRPRWKHSQCSCYQFKRRYCLKTMVEATRWW